VTISGCGVQITLLVEQALSMATIPAKMAQSLMEMM
jgi:hypothetical protein